MHAPSPSPPFEAPLKRSAAGLSAATRASHLAAAGDLGRGAAQADARFTLGAPDLPYTVKLAYRVGPEGLVVKVDASPWAIVKHNGISLGRTPQDAPEGRRHRISLLRPGQANALDVTLLWSSAAR